MKSFELHLLAADHPVFEGNCESLIFPAFDGFVGIQAHHCSMVAAVEQGTMRFRPAGTDDMITILVSTGVVKAEQNTVVVLVDTAEYPDEVEANRAKEARDAELEKTLSEKNLREYRAVEVHLKSDITQISGRRNEDEDFLDGL